jgi:RNA polymerase sigma factor (TIGR02999 family)
MSAQTVTDLLALELDGREAVDLLVPLVYKELRTMASRQLRRESAATIHTTTLVHEAYLKLAAGRPVSPENRAHFFGAASRAMRQVLVDAARRRDALKRGSGERPVELDEGRVASEILVAQVLEVDDALHKLAGEYPRQARVVECRFFGGLDVEETSAALGLSARTVKRDWALARAWLHRELGPEQVESRSD